MLTIRFQWVLRVRGVPGEGPVLYFYYASPRSRRRGGVQANYVCSCVRMGASLHTHFIDIRRLGLFAWGHGRHDAHTVYAKLLEYTQ